MNRTRSNAIQSAFECVLSRRIKRGVPFAPPLPVLQLLVQGAGDRQGRDEPCGSAAGGKKTTATERKGGYKKPKCITSTLYPSCSFESSISMTASSGYQPALAPLSL
jgi:hypothetical protein